MNEVLYQISVLALPVIIAITFHEAAHGWVAWRLGDDTAYRMGRVTFNPLRHIDPFGTIVLPGMLLLISQGHAMFGYAKPVPVNFARLHQPRRDMVLVAAAGPGINLVLALTAAFLLHAVASASGDFGQWLGANLINAVFFNVVIAIFNMLPVPPLDGGRVAVGILPRPLGTRLARLERYGFLIILGAVFVLPLIGRQLGVNLNIFNWLVIGPAEAISIGILDLAGVK